MSETPRLLSELSESDLIAHHLACAAAMVAASKGLTPQNIDDHDAIDSILVDVKNAYQYAFWRANRHHTMAVGDIIKSLESNNWK